MDPSIMKLLEEDEDETMHSGADVEAFTAALNRHIEGGDSSAAQPADSAGVLSEGNGHTSNQFVEWNTTNQGENTLPQSLQDSNVTLQKSYNSSEMMELERLGQDAENQQQNDSSQELTSLPLHHLSSKDACHPSLPEQPMLQPMDMQSSDKNPVPMSEHNRTQNPDSQYLKLHGVNTQQSISTAMTGQYSMSVGTSSQQPVPTRVNSQTEMVSMTGSQSAGNAHQQGKQVPFAMLFPHIQPLLDKDRAMQLQTIYHKLRRNEISKEGFVKHMRSLIGDQMLKMAVIKFQSQAASESHYGSNQFPPQSQASMQQHLQTTSNDSSNLTIDSTTRKVHEAEHQADLHGLPGSQVSSSGLVAIKQEREHPTFPLQGLSNHQQKHFHFSQPSFSSFVNMGNTYHPYSSPNTSSMPTPLKSQPHDPHIRPISAHQNVGATQLGPGTQTINMMATPKFERQNSFGEPRKPVAHMTSSSITQQSPPQWQTASNTERRNILPQPMMNVKAEPTDQLHDQQLKSQLPSHSFSPVQNEPGSSTIGNSNDETFDMQSSRMGLLTAGQRAAQNLGSVSMPPQVDTSNSLSSNTLAVTSPGGPGNNVKNLSKKPPSIGQKKPLEARGSSPPPSGKKQKVSGAFADQSIEQLNDVTAVSGVNLREEEEQLFSGPKEDSRVSEASRRAVQEEEEQLILQKIPLQKKLTEIMGKCGLKNMSNDVERCLSLCVEERLRGLISTIIRLSKQRADFEKTRHRTIVTSDVRQQIMTINRKAREEWEKKQSESEKLPKSNEPDGAAAADSDKDRDDGQSKSVKVNKEDDDKMRTTAANVAARAAVGGDDMLSKWQLMAEQAKQKRDAASGSHHGKDLPQRTSSSSRNTRDNQDVEKMGSTAIFAQGDDRGGRNQTVSQTRVGCSITVKDVIAVLEREPQMSKSTLIYRLYERIRSEASAE